MTNILLISLFITYFIGICVYTIIVNERSVLKTDTISRIEHAKYGGSSRARYDEYHLQNKNYYIELGYALIPSIRIILERNKNYIGNEISYYVDRKQIEKYENRKIKRYTDIGIVEGKECPKKIWYWFTLLSYVQKYSIFLFASLSLFVLLLVFYRPITSAEKIWLGGMIFYYILWLLVF